jgi:hypothetical protein
MNVLDRIAEDHIDLIAGEVFEGDGDDARMMMSSTIEECKTKKTASASYSFSRIQQPEMDMHQDIATPDFWTISKNRLIRIVPTKVKG